MRPMTRAGTPMRKISVRRVGIRLTANLIGLVLFAGAVAPACPTSPDPAAANARELLDAGDYSALERRFGGLQAALDEGRASEAEVEKAFKGAFADPEEKYGPRLDSWVAGFPNSYSAHTARAIHQFSAGFRARGEKWASEAQRSLLDQALKVEPSTFLVRRAYMLSMTPRWGGSYVAMRAFLGECERARLPAQSLRTLEAIIHLDQGSMARSRENHTSALESYRRALGLLEGIDGSDRMTALRGYVRTSRSLNRLPDAIPQLNEWISSGEATPAAYSWRAWVLMQQKKHREAWADLLVAAERENAWSQYMIASAYWTGAQDVVAKDRNAALTWMHRAARNGSKDAQKFLERVQPQEK
ncbi:MAG: DUF4034 domain-containing protein [Betaproteobacteria bacterium]|nr:MAG: DUF4034 domain-containing protein [Betaproteobacteria bacterium]